MQCIQPLVVGILCACVPLVRSTGPPYNETEAKVAVQYARAVFCKDESLLTWTCGDACNDAPVVEGSVRILYPGSVKALVARVPPADSGRCIASFRGSVNMKNYMINLNFNSKPWIGGDIRVHGGMLETYFFMRQMLLETLTSLHCKTLTVAGHSLGAGIATIATLDLRFHNIIHVDHFWTFGSPRIGNEAFVALFIDVAARQGVSPPSWRVTHANDPVPHTGPTRLLHYEHVPQEVFYNGESSSHETCSWHTRGYAESSSCGTNTLKFWGVLGFAHNDHLWYLNKSFGDMDAECRLPQPGRSKRLGVPRRVALDLARALQRPTKRTLP